MTHITLLDNPILKPCEFFLHTKVALRDNHTRAGSQLWPKWWFVFGHLPKAPQVDRSQQTHRRVIFVTSVSSSASVIFLGAKTHLCKV